MARKDASLSNVILAAGGLVWRNSPNGRQIAIVHRPKYDDWTLPKGKLDPGESWQDGAVREVQEETGFEVNLGAFAGGYTYLARRAPKVVLYWHMEIEGDSSFAPEDPTEVDALEWVSAEQARKRLSSTHERVVLARSTESGSATRRSRLGRAGRSWIRRVAGRKASSGKRGGWTAR
jgi:8-oxo-dGTP diphosphatase